MSGPTIVSVRRIWDRAAHCAFTDLARFRRVWYCVFREAAGHAGSRGKVRVLESADGAAWRSAALLSEKGIDLRDPKLSVAADGRLMLLMGGTAPSGRQPRVSFSADGRRWTAPRRVLSEGDWLWRVTWFHSRAYGISYRVESRRRWTVALYESANGVDYRKVCGLQVPGLPNEATLRFNPGGRATALVRREGGDRSAWIGRSRPPYSRWVWRPAGHRIGGPNFIVLPSGEMWGAGRGFEADRHCTLISRMTEAAWRPVLELPSAGDCGYPGLSLHRGLLWVSYYSSHEGRTSIYLARVRLGRPGARRGHERAP